ncbi:hypothetical protein Lser_V15G00109 [Lactuca serriola]
MEKLLTFLHKCGNHVKHEIIEDFLQAVASGDNLVQDLIGVDTTKIVNEMESIDQSDDDSDFEDEDSDFEDDESDIYVLDDGDENSDVSLGDREKLETMCLSHPIDFATAEVPINHMDRPGLLRPAFVRENSKEELQKDESSRNGTSYYKLEMIKMQLISAHGNQEG